MREKDGPMKLLRMFRQPRWLLVLLLMAAFARPAVLAVPRAAAAGDCTVAAGEADLDAEEQQFMTLLNDYRTGQGLAPVDPTPPLLHAAAWMSADSAARGFS